MGWTCAHRPREQSVRDYVKRQYEWENEKVSCRVLDMSIVRFRTAYLACETFHKEENRTQTWGGVCLIQHCPSSQYNICTKEMDETVGPVESECPERILDLIKDPPANDWAREWRERCRAYHTNRKNKRRA